MADAARAQVHVLFGQRQRREIGQRGRMTEPPDLHHIGAALEPRDIAVPLDECVTAHVRDDLAGLEVGQIGRREFHLVRQERAQFGLQTGHRSLRRCRKTEQGCQDTRPHDTLED